MKTKTDFIVALIFIGVCLSAGYISSLLSGVSSFGATYSQFNKPSFAPPVWVFGPAWTILYVLMGIASYLVWKERDKKKISIPMALFFIQLLLNFFWSIIFFGTHNYFGAFVEIIILLFFIILTAVYFYKVSKWAAYLLIPYILWVSFASLLNFTVWMIN